MNFLTIWKNIISNPFEGFTKVGDDTKWLLPLLSLLILTLMSIALIMPLMQSKEYTGAVVRAAVAKQAEKGTEMSAEAQAAMSEQLSSPVIKKITIASAFGGGIISFVIILLLNTLLIKIITAIQKEKIKFSLIFKVLIFISIITVIQSLIKSGITLTGDWARVLNRVNDTAGLKLALSAPVSLAALFSADSLGSTGYFVLDVLSDIFNWIYYIFLYAGLKVAAGLSKKHALIATIITASIFVSIGLLFNIIT